MVHNKQNVLMVKRGDINFTVSHITPKSFVCCIFKHMMNNTTQQHKKISKLQCESSFTNECVTLYTN